MMRTDKDALICDLAETYNIYDYESLPIKRVAIYAIGLRENSRIKMKMNNQRAEFRDLMLAAVLDRVSLLLWLKTEDGQKNINRPVSVLDSLRDEVEDTLSYDSGHAFEEAWKEIAERR